MTPEQEVASTQISAARNSLAVELSKSDRDLVASRTMLETFRLQLKAMADNVTRGTLPPRGTRKAGMGRVIADSWPLDHPLGEAIVFAEQTYIGLP